MIVEPLKGSQRAILLRTMDHFAKATKAAVKSGEAAFLPTLHGETQEGLIEEAKKLIPPVDDVARDWEAPESLVGMYRQGLVVHARVVDKVRVKEREETISTQDSDALIAEMQEMLIHFHDERNVERVLTMTRNTEAVEKSPKDPRQIDFMTDVKKKARDAMVTHAATGDDQ